MDYIAELQRRRRENLKSLLHQYKTQRAMSEAIGLAVAQISHILNGEREMGDNIARRIESALRMPLCWMDRDPSSDAIGCDVSMMLPADESALLSDYHRLSEKHREMLRETAAGYVVLETQNASEKSG
jgi:transcriptional regulator with XRE-family HTH domain